MTDSVVSHLEKSIAAPFGTASWQMRTIRQASPRVLIDYSNHVINCRWCIAVALCTPVLFVSTTWPQPFLSAISWVGLMLIDSSRGCHTFFAVDLPIFIETGLCVWSNEKRNDCPLHSIAWPIGFISHSASGFHFSFSHPFYTIHFPCLVVALESITHRYMLSYCPVSASFSNENLFSS